MFFVTCLKIVSVILAIVGVTFSIPLAVAFYYGEASVYNSFIIPGAISIVLFAIVFLCTRKVKFHLTIKQTFAVVALSWIAASFMGSFPLYFSGCYPQYTNAFFESVSGFTTTGCTVCGDVESLPRSINMWRCLTHWLGGMGVLVLILAILPLSGSYNLYLMKAESAGPSVGKFVPKIKDTAKILYSIYLGITIIEIIALCITGLPLYDAMTLTFSTVGTGGFGLLNDSIGSYSMTTGCVIIVFMLICSINFNLYFLLLKGKIKDVFKSEELRLFLIIVIVATLAVFFNIRKLYSGTTESLYHSLFQVASIISTTK